MRILAFTDIHGSIAALKDVIRKSKEADLLICCGDLTIFSHNLHMILLELNRIDKPVFLVHGNHESSEEMRKKCEQFKNLRFIHKHSFIHEGIFFIGYGGGGFSIHDEQFEKFAHKLKWDKETKTVLVTHGPPYGTRQDALMRGHCGSKSYRHFITERKINLVICGHIHENSNTKTVLGKTLIINPGPKGTLIRI
jgi:Icc-related predicted phosphoesterase